VDRSIAVAKANQTIAFPAISNKNAGDSPFTVNATASSGLPVTYSIVSGPATVNGNTITLTGGTGTVTVRACQTGNACFNAAPCVDRTFSVLTDVGQPQTITFNELPNKTYGDLPFALSATASSGLPVSFEIVSQDPATIISLNGSTITINGAGTARIRATQPGNDTYRAAPAVERTLLINKAPLTVTAANKTKVQGAANPPLTYAYSGFVNGDDAGDIDTPPVATTTATANSPAGTYPITVSGGSDNNYAFTYVAGTLTITGGEPVPDDIFRINAGGEAYTTSDGRTFSGETYASGGNRSLVVSSDIVGTTEDALYQTGRHGGQFSYNIPIDNGTYYVVLHFAETYWGNVVAGGIGSRKFNVNIERNRRLSEYDIYARAGGALKAVQEGFRTIVYDNMLNINFYQGSADFPTVKAIEVLPVGEAYFINAGGEAYTTSDGRTFSGETYASGGNRSLVVSSDIVGTTEDALYQTGRHGGQFSYNIPIDNGTYYVVLHFAETYWGNVVAGGVGSRKFNVNIERNRRLSEYDIYARAGGALKAVQEGFRTIVYDNMLNINFYQGSANFPTVKAIEVYAETAASARVAAMDSSPEEALSGPAGVFPNPVQDRLRVSLSVPADQIKGTFVTDASGTECLRNAHRVASENELEMNVSELKTGLYLLRLESAKGYRTLKFIKR
jgi:hypothetical protein